MRNYCKPNVCFPANVGFADNSEFRIPNYFQKPLLICGKLCYNSYVLTYVRRNFYMKLTQSKTFWRGLWLAAVALGGVALVKVAFEILNLTDKKYIDL